MTIISCGAGLRKNPPVFIPITEATADANTFVCEFTGGVGASETGAGGGLTGADLVLTANGSPAGVSGGFRALDGTDDFFISTAAMLAAMLSGDQWTIMWRVKNWAHNATAKYLARIAATNPYLGYLEMGKVAAVGNFNFESFNANGGQNRSSAGNVLSDTFDGWLAIWRINNIIHGGFKAGDTAPTGWDFFASPQRMIAPGAGSWSGSAWTTQRHIVGSPDAGGCPVLAISKLVVSKVGLAGINI